MKQYPGKCIIPENGRLGRPTWLASGVGQSGYARFCRNPPYTDEYVVKTYSSDFLFRLDPTDSEEQISTRDPSNFQEIQSNLQNIFSAPLDF